jgi:hypothetical protein
MSESAVPVIRSVDIGELVSTTVTRGADRSTHNARQESEISLSAKVSEKESAEK